MRSMEAYPRAAMERALKVQDVMLQAMAKKITRWQAAEIIGISDRLMRRWVPALSLRVHRDRVGAATDSIPSGV